MIEWLRSLLLSLLPWGTEVIVSVQSWSTPFLDRFFAVCSFLGDEEFFLLLLPLVYWCFSKRAGRGLAYALLLSAYVNSLLKHIFLIPRPADPRIRVLRPVDPPTPSFPSGHAQDGVAVWGFLANRVRRAVGWLAAILIMFLIGFSRVWVGVHYPQDILSGWLLGILFLGLFLWLLPQAEGWLARQPPALKLALAIVLPIAGLLLHGADLRGLYPAPDAATTMGAILGMSVGFLFEPRGVRFRVAGPWWKRLLRLVVGLLIVALFWQGPKLFLPEEMAHGLAMALRFLRYACTGLAATLLAPWLFVRLRLAGSEASA
ncbi:MAG: phosphatase PAP2 family protein [Anaerolineae bacterium]|nr:phosphatase PAP2 family protein [Anaerolineae bacterium]